ncbi:MAG: hypothetical protein J7497_07455 [Chitinophagaceae bacterium]|nr:hypothetical protein [Chitinophagaceae bacterium]
MQQDSNRSRFPEQEKPIKKHGDSLDQTDKSGEEKKEEYINTDERQNDLNDPRRQKEDPRNEGHVKEWQDRARVVLDAKEAVNNTASPNQSPSEEDVEEKSDRIKGDNASY